MTAYIFIDAPGGTGKTFLFNLLLDIACYYDIDAVATASSGIASTLLTIGITAHAASKLPIPPAESSACQFTPRDCIGRKLINPIYHLVENSSFLEAIFAKLYRLLNNETFDFPHWLLQIGEGTHDIITSERFLLPPKHRTIRGLIDFVYDIHSIW
eukprot:GHVS01068452.1.p2 GENE.GHVS01068452.1~~GHVS01068452.1.p2  ORF type:complete len:156 (-),score=8.96 GHVS01068452.1:164-631(-)